MNKHNRLQRRLAFRLMQSSMMRAFAATRSVAMAKVAGNVLSWHLTGDAQSATSGYLRARTEARAQENAS